MTDQPHRQTDHTNRSVTKGRNYLRSTAMRPNNNIYMSVPHSVVTVSETDTVRNLGFFAKTVRRRKLVFYAIINGF